MTLGERAEDILRLVIWEGISLMLVGVAAGALCALVVTRAMRSMLFEVSAADPWTYITLTAVLLLVGAFAAYIPARRAVRVDPMVALRYEQLMVLSEPQRRTKVATEGFGERGGRGPPQPFEFPHGH